MDHWRLNSVTEWLAVAASLLYRFPGSGRKWERWRRRKRRRRSGRKPERKMKRRRIVGAKLTTPPPREGAAPNTNERPIKSNPIQSDGTAIGYPPPRAPGILSRAAAEMPENPTRFIHQIISLNDRKINSDGFRWIPINSDGF